MSSRSGAGESVGFLDTLGRSNCTPPRSLQLQPRDRYPDREEEDQAPSPLMEDIVGGHLLPWPQVPQGREWYSVSQEEEVPQDIVIGRKVEADESHPNEQDDSGEELIHVSARRSLVAAKED